LITKEDILRTYSFYKESGENAYLKELLKNIDIKDAGDYLEFSAKSADVLLLDIFTLPVLPSTQIAALTDKNKPIATESLIVSGAFKGEKQEAEKNTGSTKVSLIQNEKYTEGNVYIKKYVFRFFSSALDLLKNEDILNGIIFHPSDLTQAPPSPRFEKYQYLYPQYISLFINSESVHQGMRQLILNALNQTTYPELDKEQGALIQNPFLGSQQLPIAQPKQSLETTLGALGYFKKSSLIGEIQKKQAVSKSGSVSTITNNQYFIAPAKQKSYVTVAKPEIIIAGWAPAGVEAVYINNYKLTSFVPGNTKFYFKASTALKTLNDGKNTYTLHFLINKKKIYKETLSIYVEKDDAAVKTRQATIAEENKKALANAPKTPAFNLAQTQTKIAALEDAYYYDINFNKFSLSLSYTKSSDIFTSLTTQIQKELKLL